MVASVVERQRDIEGRESEKGREGYSDKDKDRQKLRDTVRERDTEERGRDRVPDRVKEKNRRTDNRYNEGGEVWTVYLYRIAFGTNLPRCLDCYLARSTESCFIDVKPQIYCSREIQTHPQKAGVRTRIRHTRKKNGYGSLKKQGTVSTLQ